MNLVSLPRLNELRFPADPVPMAKLWRWCREGRLPARKIGGDWYVDLDAFDNPPKAEEKQASTTVRLVVDRLRRV